MVDGYEFISFLPIYKISLHSNEFGGIVFA
jgi:hypothetical protein